LVFTQENGKTFASDVRAVSAHGRPHVAYDSIGVKLNNSNRTVTQENIVSNDGAAYHCLPIIHYDIANVGGVPLEINADRLIYNIEERFEEANFDFYGAYADCEVKTLDLEESKDMRAILGEMMRLFENAPDNPVRLENGSVIYSVVFAKVNLPSKAPAELPSNMPPADGEDLGGLFNENNIIGIKYLRHLVQDGRSYVFTPRNLQGNDDHLGMGMDIDDEVSCFFFRVASFEDLANLGGVNFYIDSYNFIEGDWHIKTEFAPNIEPSTINVNTPIETKNQETSFVLTKAEISLLSTALTYEVRDNVGKLLQEISGYDLNEYYLRSMPDEIKLVYNDGGEIILSNYAYSNMGVGGIINVVYDTEISPTNYALMNTSNLTAIIVNGEVFSKGITN